MQKFIHLIGIIGTVYLLYPVSCAKNTGCDDGWLPYNDNCYMINTVKGVSRSAAAAECNAKDSSLLRIKSQDQLTWLINTLKQYPSSGYWTDLNDIPKVKANRLGTGVWKWGMYEYANMSLIQWNQSPANDGQSKCGAANIQGKLADLKCKAKEGYICQYQSPDGGCVLGWIQGTDACFWVANTSDPTALKTWDQAKAFCEGQGNGAVNPKLFVIDDQNDVAFLSGEIPYLSQNTKVHWIGLQSTTTGTWSWYTGGSVDTSLVQWQSEPDNVAGIENCGVLRMTGVFSDRDCSSHANYICYKPQYNYSPTDNVGCGPWVRAGQFCYSFMSSTIQKTWTDARSYCLSTGGDLMKVDSFDKKAWLEQQTVQSDNSRNFWTGLNDRQNDGTYVWADGTPLNNSYINWNQEPNDRAGNEDCGLIWNTGVYNDISCKYFHTAAICELDNIATCPTTPPGWKSFGGNCYLFTPYKNSSQLLSANEAAAYCATFATNKTNVGSLLSVNSQAEKAFILSQVKSIHDNPDGWFTSLNDKQLEGYWTFSSGPLLDKSLVDWEGEPSTYKGNDCGMVVFGGNYHEVNCNDKLSFICERYATGVNTGVITKTNAVLGILLLLVKTIF